MRYFAARSRTTHALALLALTILGLYAVWRVLRSVYIVCVVQDAPDFEDHFRCWNLAIHSETASKAFKEFGTYLPYVWLLFSPLFVFGWTVSKYAWCAANFALVVYIWWRLSNLLDITGLRRWFFLCCWGSFVSVGAEIGHGNLSIVSLAGVLAAYPFKTVRQSVFLIPAAFKQSVSYLIYLFVLLKRPKSLLLPVAVLAGTVLGWMLLMHVSPADLTEGFQIGLSNTQKWMGEFRMICIVPVLERVLGNRLVARLLAWVICLTLFWYTMRKVKDPLVQLALLLLASLLPWYQGPHQMIVTVPVLGLLIKHRHPIWAVLMTVPLSGLWDAIPNRNYFGIGWLQTVGPLVYPLLVLAFIGAMIHLDIQLRRSAPGS